MSYDLTTSVPSPADIVAQLMIDEGQATDPADRNDWPVYVGTTPKKPDEVIAVFDTTGRKDGRSMIDGETFTHKGIQVSFRAGKKATCFSKAKGVKVWVDQAVYQDSVVLDGLTDDVHCLSRTGPLLYAGQDPESRRYLYTLNALVTYREAGDLDWLLLEDGGRLLAE